MVIVEVVCVVNASCTDVKYVAEVIDFVSLVCNYCSVLFNRNLDGVKQVVV